MTLLIPGQLYWYWEYEEPHNAASCYKATVVYLGSDEHERHLFLTADGSTFAEQLELLNRFQPMKKG